MVDFKTVEKTKVLHTGLNLTFNAKITGLTDETFRLIEDSQDFRLALQSLENDLCNRIFHNIANVVRNYGKESEMFDVDINGLYGDTSAGIIYEKVKEYDDLLGRCRRTCVISSYGDGIGVMHECHKQGKYTWELYDNLQAENLWELEKLLKDKVNELKKVEDTI